MIIRGAELKDFKEIYDLSSIKELRNPDGSPPKSYWLKELIKRKLSFVAEIDNKIGGFIMAEESAGKCALLWYLGVKKEYRKEGIGTLLVKKLENESKKRKIKLIFLTSPGSNKETLQFYKRKGFQRGNLTYEFWKFLK